MKAIISHDIDHITVWEHLTKDTILPKYIVRSNIELATGKISLLEYFNRFGDFFKNKWQNINELIEFNNQNNIPSSFFIGVQNGLGLSYSNTAAIFWIREILKQKCELGVHGIEFQTLEEISKEFNLFQEFSNQKTFGTRMHYVRTNEHTFNNMNEAGYTYDSTEHAFKNPYKIGNMWEFPFQIMDGWVIEKGKRWQTQNLQQAIDNTKQLIDKAHSEKLTHLGIDFHDRYFSKSNKTWMNWYMWLVEYLKKNEIECINFNTAIAQLENENLVNTANLNSKINA